MKKKINDELDKHPFYSDYGVRQFEKRRKELEKLERELAKRRPKTNGESVQEIPNQET